jgi:hypothetical protein
MPGHRSASPSVETGGNITIATDTYIHACPIVKPLLSAV